MTQLRDYITGWSAWPPSVPAPLKGYRYESEGGKLYSIPRISWWQKAWYWLVRR